ncbi:MAG: antibiotic biosynthesis monooxygenase family protein [Acidimicrobiales bacterium]
MSIIKINAITVAADSGDELAHRFAKRAGAVDDQDGFEGFELLQPTDDRTTWLVVTRWRDEDAFNAWVSSPAFGAGHQSETTSGEGGDRPPSGHPHGGAGGSKPVGVSSELWSYKVAGGSSVGT